MTRLLVHFEYATLNGGERSWLATLSAVREAGFDVSAVGPAEGPLADELVRREVTLHPLEYYAADGRRRDLADIRASLAAIIRQHEPELFHANSLSTSRISGPVVQEQGLPSLGHLRDIIKLKASVIRDLNCHRRLLAVSQATRDFHIAQGLDEERVEVCYNGVDVELFQPRPRTGHLHDHLGIEPNAPLIAAIGQIGLRKGFDVFVAAATELANRWKGDTPRPHFLIVGERHSQKEESVQFEQQLRAAAERPPLSGHLHFLGWRSDLPELLSELSALVHPARQEPLGRVLLEAAACGVPVIATNVGGTAEIFPRESQAARLVPPDDTVALTAAIEEVLTDESLQQQLCERGRQQVQTVFSRQQAAKRLITHYRALLQQTLP